MSHCLLVVTLLAMGATTAMGVEKKAAKPPATTTDVAAVSKPAVDAKQQPAADAGLKKLRKIVEGQVVHVGKRALSLEYAVKETESNEMLLPFSEDLKTEGVARVADLQYGDRVKVGIEQTYREVPDSDPVIVKTEALVVALVERAAQAQPAPEATVTQ